MHVPGNHLLPADVPVFVSISRCLPTLGFGVAGSAPFYLPRAWVIFTGTGTVTAAGLFAEGFGRDAAGNDGLGSAKFFWGPVVEPHLLGASADLKAARAAVQRITYATRVGELLLRSSGAGAAPLGVFAAIPDDPGAVPNQCIPG